MHHTQFFKINFPIEKNFLMSQRKRYRKSLKQIKEIFLDSLSSFISDFPEEETSHQIAEKLTYWLSELACLIPQI